MALPTREPASMFTHSTSLLAVVQEAEAAIQADLESLSKQLEGEVCARQRLQKCRAELETLLDRLREELEVDRARYEVWCH